mmetsp:Transcript_9690/g.21737  ORF Transcript_9690/g.21737 Transcript_9690/m.21737 type:complete len:161 (+) Transcript_9690:95-577(+)
MQFRVIVPQGSKSGQTLRIRCPDGSMGDIAIPRGLKEGDTFIFQMDVPDENAVREAQKRQQQNGAAIDPSPATSSSASCGGGVGSRKRHQQGGSGGASVAGTAVTAAATTASVTSPQGASFLDREIIDVRDFVAALGIGMLIGISIVAGFLVGVLMATDP